MRPQVSLITLGVRDLARARAFYEALGWRASAASNESIVFFQLDNGAGLALYPRDEMVLAGEGDRAGQGSSGMTLACNVGSEAEVDRLAGVIERAGARIVLPPAKVFWGGYSAHFADPDGHLWEIAYNPFCPLDENGGLQLPPPERGSGSRQL